MSYVDCFRSSPRSPKPVYRQGVEALTRHRLNIVESANGDLTAAAEKLGEGQIEEALDVANDELIPATNIVEGKLGSHWRRSQHPDSVSTLVKRQRPRHHHREDRVAHRRDSEHNVLDARDDSLFLGNCILRENVKAEVTPTSDGRI
ncbi:hypothetical protein D9611_006946 [Ephemerocybe angulata]|uniref:Uncharacterized protein n=1 Tax=Ephemerocybe angulata TaxID=980116 RepID=A0A8H5EW32_9AGAR|nr:hypothetical protein D9611_006946 [Tulosesus angulatus]